MPTTLATHYHMAYPQSKRLLVPLARNTYGSRAQIEQAIAVGKLHGLNYGKAEIVEKLGCASECRCHN